MKFLPPGSRPGPDQTVAKHVRSGQADVTYVSLSVSLFFLSCIKKKEIPEPIELCHGGKVKQTHTQEQGQGEKYTSYS